MGEVKMLQNFCNFGQQGMDESCLSLRRTFAEVINTDRRHDNNKNLLDTMKIAAFHAALFHDFEQERDGVRRHDKN